MLSCTWPPLSTAYEQAGRTSWRLLSEKQFTACKHTRPQCADQTTGSSLPASSLHLGQHDV